MSKDTKNYLYTKNKNKKKTKKGVLLKQRLKTKIPFSYQRLIAIYTSFKGYLEFEGLSEKCNKSIYSVPRSTEKNIITDVNSIIDLNLIKVMKSAEQMFIMGRKLIINFNAKFASIIAKQLGSRLEEFIDIDY